MTHIIKVANVSCSGCVSTIETELIKVEGVNRVSVANDKTTVTVEGSAEKTTLTDALAELGYPEKQ